MFPLNSISASNGGSNRVKTNFCSKLCVLGEDGKIQRMVHMDGKRTPTTA